MRFNIKVLIITIIFLVSGQKEIPNTIKNEPSISQNNQATHLEHAMKSDNNENQLLKPLISPNETIKLSFVGDCTIGTDEAYKYNTFTETYNKNNSFYFFKEVQSVFANDDYTFINLEGVFTESTKKANKEFRYKGPTFYANILKEGSIEGVTLANNHTLDYFQKGFDDTVESLKNANIDYAYFEKYIIKEIKGSKIGFLGYKAWVTEQKSKELLVKQVDEMEQAGVDFIVANFHWGDMYNYQPNEAQKRLAHFAIDNGVDLVIGHHPHIMQGMETYKGKNILYSLGNFCYGGHSNPKDKDTIIYQHILEFNPNLKRIEYQNYNIIAAKVSGENNRNNFQPIIAADNEETRIIEKFNSLKVN